MKGVVLFSVSIFLLLVSVRGYWHAHEANLGKEKVTHFRLYLQDLNTGDDPSVLTVIQPTNKDNSSFGSVFVLDDPLTEGPEPTSKVVGNGQGLVVSTGRGHLSSVLGLDFGFTTGEFNGSSFSLLSRNLYGEPHREVAVVGGREKFRFARGFAEIRTISYNSTNGDGIYEFNVTVLHYEKREKIT